jgi:uncharacterized repeat protein (TIGR03806 family)
LDLVRTVARSLALLLVSSGACRDASSADAGDSTSDAGTTSTAASESGASEDTGTPMLPPRPDTQSCRFEGLAPGLLPGLALTDEIVDASLADVVDVAPASDRTIVAERGGRLLSASEGGALELVADLGERGLVVAIAPAPDFATTGALFVRYEAASGPTRAVVARFTVDLATWTIDLATERSAMEISDAVGERSGGALAFDASGMLVIGVGDLGLEPDNGSVQDRRSRIGKLLRVDVGPLTETGAVAIPPDNPFIGDGGDADEVWALGLRDPWRCALADGDALWCVDVGEVEQEVDRVTGGANLGWPWTEGTSCLLSSGDCSDLDVAGPSATYRVGDGDCGIAGAVFGVGELDATLVYADRCSGRLRAIDTSDPSGVVQDEILGEEADGLVALARAADGAALAITGDARITRIVTVPPPGEFPMKLSDSGCFADLVALAPVPGVVPYGVNAQLWSDGADKHRFVALPGGAALGVAADGSLEFPIGSVLLKTFSFDLVDGDQVAHRPVETRVMVRREYGWQFHSYRWNAAGTDADLLPAGATDVLAIDTGGTTIELEYNWPSRGNCKVCHGLGSSRALGPRLDQLDGAFDYGDAVGEQLVVLQELDMFDGELPDASAWSAMPDYGDEDAPLEVRARAYLHTNCGHCHRPGGWTPPDLTMDLRWTTALADTHTCAVDTQYYNPWIEGTQRIAPGQPDASVIWERVHQRGPGQMPPLGTNRLDDHADVVRDWIASLAACPG